MKKVILTTLLLSAALPFSVAAAEAGNGAAPVAAAAMQATDARTIIVNAPPWPGRHGCIWEAAVHAFAAPISGRYKNRSDDDQGWRR